MTFRWHRRHRRGGSLVVAAAVLEDARVRLASALAADYASDRDRGDALKAALHAFFQAENEVMRLGGVIGSVHVEPEMAGSRMESSSRPESAPPRAQGVIDAAASGRPGWGVETCARFRCRTQSVACLRYVKSSSWVHPVAVSTIE
jgi:hypothetical protein